MNGNPHLRSARFCDLVMKGGITSGVVYPRVVTEIAKTFNLKSVGGTSAGAIAAAAAAAAQSYESSAKTNRHRGGFKHVDSLPDLLSAENSSGHTNLFTFFQPQPETSRLYRVLCAALNAKSGFQAVRRVLIAAVREFWFAFAIGAAPGTILIGLAVGQLWSGLAVVSLLAGLIIAVGGGLASVGACFVLKFGRHVPGGPDGNFFGLCSGMSGEVATAQKGKWWRIFQRNKKSSEAPAIALTEWLTSYLNQTAGLEQQKSPLTFGQLWWPDAPGENMPLASEPTVKLEMMTTCLTWGRPFRLPFRDQEDARENVFYFRKSEFLRLFPKSVVEWLCDHPREEERADKKLAPQWVEAGFVPLPEPWNLPVVVATRMSLSFPVLLSAIPLYAYEPDASITERQQQPPRCCWFSDGGLCSNFPMHLFDAPLPRWPTFALNLVGKNADAGATEMARGWMPANNKEGIKESWNNFPDGRGIGRMFGFIGAIIGTMQSWSDNTLARMPGYRDRTAHVPLKPNEGGLNLDMPKELIATLRDRGAETGAQFVERFGPASTHAMNWENHRWIRLRSLLASLEETLGRLERGCAQPMPGDRDYETWVNDPNCGKTPPYQWTKGQRQTAQDTLRELRALAAKLAAAYHAGDSLTKGAPRPRPELRPRPRI